ncbi:BZ3500_MvSof-1268-A1-R1_Chr3-3g06463 [Microbotryum saponariae]|uniref:BZ3500_MvSof-1268-A1-R1_Chr3-3g06463 protein n=1 Tax=Microbotryum saponariae TaxID=289078 RepID=A0A2X0MUD0_9BASI|nr:BZ3500_MvSof-1268-A1-R1_Chr3-3g06463 [Microbotryum saponariae]SDA04430.1 BZ3501_MvSof-1269-A2-R1_Chr3-2g06150 [Microbotryum saponariae]
MSTLSSASNGHAAPPATAQASSSTGGITEDEAALYDRQLRLWGVEAQNRMRQAKVLIVNFRSLAAEIAKNIVLAGVGQVTLLDEHDVQEQDLGANFFLREDDVGQKVSRTLRAEAPSGRAKRAHTRTHSCPNPFSPQRVQVGAPRLQALNPRVELLTRTDAALVQDDTFLAQFDLVVLTDCDAPTLQRVNTSTRRLGKKLYAASSVGIDGWIFADLLEHEFVVDVIKSLGPGETVSVPTKRTLSYTPFNSIFSHSWKKSRARELKKTQSNLWGTLALLEYQRTNPGQPITLEGLKSASQELLPRLGVKTELLPETILSRIASTSAFEFPPSAAILGGIAGQDVLNVLGGKEEPVRNLMVFDGQTGAGHVWNLGE